MCRNIRTLFNFAPPATDEEIRAASLQFVRKLSGFTHPSKTNEEVRASALQVVRKLSGFTNPSKANEAACHRAVDEVAGAAHRLLDSLETTRPARDREVEAMKARARARERFA